MFLLDVIEMKNIMGSLGLDFVRKGSEHSFNLQVPFCFNSSDLSGKWMELPDFHTGMPTVNAALSLHCC